MKVEIKIPDVRLRILGTDETTISEEITRLVDKHIESIYIKDDHFEPFRKRHIEIKEGSKVKAKELFELYKTYCLENNIGFLGRNNFYEFLNKLPGVYKRGGTNNVLTIYNVAIIDEEDEWL